MPRDNRKKISKSVKKQLFARQFNGYICSNFPGSPLNKVVGFHCNSYNMFGYEFFGLTKKGMLEIEHLNPHNETGDDTINNLHLLCANCHCIKSKVENQFRNVEENKQMKNIKLLTKQECKEITVDFKDNFKRNIYKYVQQKRNDGYPLTDRCLENLVKVMNNLIH